MARYFKNVVEFVVRAACLQLFDVALNTNVTTDAGMSVEMKTYYSKYLIDTAEPELIHDQFGQPHPIPQGKGKTIEFRKYSPLPKLLTPLVEGVTPEGQELTVSALTATVAQYGGYVTLSDVLLLTAIDNNLVMATELLGRQAGRTLDTITREELNGGTNVVYQEDAVAARHLLVGGSATASDNHYMTVNTIERVARKLKTMLASRFSDGYYVGIIHPDVAYDLMQDPKWQYPHQYVDTGNIYRGEIGRIAGVRFVETTEAKIFTAPNLAGTVRTLTVTGYTAGTKVVAIGEALSAAQAAALVGRKVIIDGELSEIAAAAAGSAGAATITLKGARTEAPANADVIYPGEAGADGRQVYSTLIMGTDAYGVTEIEGGGLRHFVKQLGSAGTDDPLDQRATCGWKAIKVAKRLVEAYMCRAETTSTYESGV